MKKLQETRRLVEKLEGKLSKLLNHGFVRVPVQTKRGSNCSISTIYIHRKKNVVVKRPYLTEVNRKEDIRPPFAVPTEVVKYPTNRSCSPFASAEDFDLIFVQPLVDVSPNSQAHAHSIIIEVDSEVPDLKRQNCGLYKRKPVIFDW